METFLVLANQVRGSASQQLVIDALNHPQTFHFKALLEVMRPKLTEFPLHLEALEIFTAGGIKDYYQNLPVLNETALNKLKMLTFISSCLKGSKLMPYEQLLNDLGLDSIRQLEDLIISCIDNGLVRGKLDQKRACFVVESVSARDVTANDLQAIKQCLRSWFENTNNALEMLKQKTLAVQQAMAEKEKQDKEWQEKLKDANAKAEKKGKRPIDRQQHHLVESRLKRDR